MYQVQLLFILISLMFKPVCCDQEKTRLFLALGSVVLFILSGLHFAVAGVLIKLVNVMLNPIFKQNEDTVNAQFYPAIKYLIICGVFQSLKNIIFLICLAINRASKHVVIILVILVILEFGLNFAIAVHTSIQTTYLAEILSVYIQASPLLIASLEILYPNQYKLYIWSMYAYRIVLAEAIVTFVVMLPIISAQIAMIFGLSQNLGEQAKPNNTLPMQTFPQQSSVQKII